VGVLLKISGFFCGWKVETPVLFIHIGHYQSDFAIRKTIAQFVFDVAGGFGFGFLTEAFGNGIVFLAVNEVENIQFTAIYKMRQMTFDG
jgi:hypothetical protein